MEKERVGLPNITRSTEARVADRNLRGEDDSTRIPCQSLSPMRSDPGIMARNRISWTRVHVLCYLEIVAYFPACSS